jgi:hypothetical protein
VRTLQHIDEAFSLNDECAEIRDKKQVDILEGDLLQEIPKREFANGSLDGLLLDSELDFHTTFYYLI